MFKNLNGLQLEIVCDRVLSSFELTDRVTGDLLALGIIDPVKWKIVSEDSVVHTGTRSVRHLVYTIELGGYDV